MRTRQVLHAGWAIRQLEPGQYDVHALPQDANWLATSIPAQVHDVLLAHGLIPDPRFGRNAAASAWVGAKDWAYAGAFASPAGEGPVFLRFEGLDTLATVYVNGAEVAQCDNMYRRYAVQVRPWLRPADERNDLLIVFASPLRFVAEAPQRFGAQEGVAAQHYLRKCHSDFGSYLGARPHSAKVGIYADVILDVPSGAVPPACAWFEDVCVRPTLSDDLTSAHVQVLCETAGAPAQIAWRLEDPSGQMVTQGAAATSAGGWQFEVPSPHLWWPRTHGQPRLYTLHLELRLDGVRGSPMPCDSQSVAFGLRQVRPILADPQTGEKRFAFEVNGQRVFLRGACWAPLEGMTHCWSPERAARLLDLVEQGHMNILRVWAEGYIPPQSFYDECDRRGILVWQDFMFGYGKHPGGLPAFDVNCRAELEDMVRRLRNHPCLLLWCGGNENYMGWDFSFGAPPAEKWGLFEQTMPQVCATLDPGRFFHPSSPYGGHTSNWPLEGDWHDYTTLKFTPQASVPLYASEIGRVSAPSVANMRRFLADEDLWPTGYDARVRQPGQPAWPEMWQYRSVDGSWDKIGPIEAFCDPISPEGLVRALGTAHGEYLLERVARHRRGVPDGASQGDRRCWGTTIWRLNDAWPILYWSAVDYYLEPKIPYYFLRRAYAPVLVCFERTADRIAVWVVNDSPDPVMGRLVLRRLRFDGAVLGELTCEVALSPGAARRSLDATALGTLVLREEFLQARLAHGELTEEATLLLSGERYLHLPSATLTVRAVTGGLEVATDVFARQVTLRMADVAGAVFEDNYFDLSPSGQRMLRVLNPAGGHLVSVGALNAAEVRVDWPTGS